MRLTRLARRTRRVYDAKLAPSGLGILQFGLLNSVWSRDGASLSEHAAALDIDRTTMTRNVRPLVRAGLLRQDNGRDARTSALFITDAGKERVRAARPFWRKAQATLEASLGEVDFAAMERALDIALEKVPEA